MSSDYLLNIPLVGDSGVGKTRIFERLKRDPNYIWKEDFEYTIGVDFFSRFEESLNKKAKIQLWDTSGLNKFKQVTQHYYIRSHGFIFVYDVANKQSFNNIKNWIQEVKQSCNPQACFILVGNKIESDTREVSEEEGKTLAESLGIDYFEVSAKEDKGIEEPLKVLIENILKQGEFGKKLDESNGGFVLTKKEIETGKEMKEKLNFECNCF